MKTIYIALLLILFSINSSTFYAQEKPKVDKDAALKEQIYKANKAKVMNYSLKESDELFFDFSKKKSDPKIILTKEEFYGYTIKIAIFSDRLAALYPKQKEMAAKSKEKWFAESYDDYLLTKNKK